MSRRAFDRFMVAVDISTNPKIGRLTDPEFRCLVTGVWPLAAKSDPRGYLLVGRHPATERDVSHQARCAVSVARRTLSKLRELGMLERDEQTGWESCHDWDEINPAPKTDRTNAERQRRYRDAHNGVSNASDNGATTADNGEEVEEKGNGKGREERADARVSPERLDRAKDRLTRGAVQRVFDAWIQATGRTSRTELDSKRRGVITRALKTYPEGEVIDAVRGWRHDPHNRGENDRGRPFNDLDLLLRDAAHIERFRDLEQASRRTAGDGFLAGLNARHGLTSAPST